MGSLTALRSSWWGSVSASCLTFTLPTYKNSWKRDAIDDLVQDAFVVTHSKLATLQRQEAVGAERRAVSSCRKSRRSRDVAGVRLGARFKSSQPSPVEMALIPLLGIMCVMLAASRALAAPVLFVDLKYAIDPALKGCPSAGDFRNMVSQQLGYDPHRAEAPIHVVVSAEAVERGIEGAIHWDAPTQERVRERRLTSRSRDCRELIVAMGFVVAVQIQVLATELTAGPASAPQAATAATPAPAASPAETEPVAARPAPPAPPEAPPPIEIPSSAPGSTPWSTIAGIGASAGFALGPNPTAQGRIFFGLQHAAASLEFGAEASLPTTTRQTDGIGFRQNLILGTLAACGHYRFAAACALGKFGQIRVRGLGVDVPSSPTGFIAQAGPRLVATLGLGKQLLLLGHVDALVLLTPWTVELNHTDFWKMPRFGAALGIDLAARFR